MLVDLLPPTHQRVQSFIDGLFNHPTLVPAAAILFGGDRWYGVEVVGVLDINGADAALCSLAPTNELGSGGPHIISLWIDHELKMQPRYLDYGVQLFKRVAEESISHYGTPATFVPATRTEYDVARKAREQGISFTLVETNIPPIDL